LGLSDPDRPEQGNWGGRYTAVQDSLFRDAPAEHGNSQDPRAAVWRWRGDFQNEFAARMDWCVNPFKEANHPPQVRLNGNSDLHPLCIEAKPGTTVTLSTAGSVDPDGNELRSEWTILSSGEAGVNTFQMNATDEEAVLYVPEDMTEQAIQILVTLRDNGTPSLCRYRRAIIQITKPML